MSQHDAQPAPIKAIDYTVIYVRDMDAMTAFYGETMGFRLVRQLSPGWIEYGIGPNILTLARQHPLVAGDAPVPAGSAALQLAFRVPVPEVDVWAAHLARKGVTAVSPPTDQPWGHRTLFFRDPDGNLVEIFADL
jgi:catechol 2,3-dioxygenase-like lactoylglutathione lyase family enzyme